jgi:hypothetical protein
MIYDVCDINSHVSPLPSDLGPQQSPQQSRSPSWLRAQLAPRHTKPSERPHVCSNCPRLARFQPPLTIHSTLQSGSGHVAAPPGYFSHHHALRYGDPLTDCDSALLAQYYSVFKNWHRIRVALPPVWSCDWRHWDEGPYFDYLE